MKHTIVLLLSGLLSASAVAQSVIRFCDVCAGFTVSKRGNDVLIRCPGKPIDKPWMTLKDCQNPKVDRTQPNSLGITCNSPTKGG